MLCMYGFAYIATYLQGSGGSRRVSVVSTEPLLKPEETFQNKFAFNLYKPTNRHLHCTKINDIMLAQLNSYLATCMHA